MSELGNLMADILLSPWRMSTVKIRAGSLFCTSESRIEAGGAGFGAANDAKTAELHFKPQTLAVSRFPPLSTALAHPAQVVHRHLKFRTCGMLAS